MNTKTKIILLLSTLTMLILSSSLSSCDDIGEEVEIVPNTDIAKTWERGDTVLTFTLGFTGELSIPVEEHNHNVTPLKEKLTYEYKKTSSGDSIYIHRPSGIEAYKVVGCDDRILILRNTSGETITFQAQLTAYDLQGVYKIAGGEIAFDSDGTGYVKCDLFHHESSLMLPAIRQDSRNLSNNKCTFTYQVYPSSHQVKLNFGDAEAKFTFSSPDRYTLVLSNTNGESKTYVSTMHPYSDWDASQLFATWYVEDDTTQTSLTIKEDYSDLNDTRYYCLATVITHKDGQTQEEKFPIQFLQNIHTIIVEDKHWDNKDWRNMHMAYIIYMTDYDMKMLVDGKYVRFTR